MAAISTASDCKSQRDIVLHAANTKPGNQICVDCDAPKPEWCSVNLGVFMCIQCAGVHRSMGIDVSQVRNVMLDDWTASMTERFQQTCNTELNQVYEYHVPKSTLKPRAASSPAVRKAFILDKYANKMFMKSSSQEPQPPVFDEPQGDLAVEKFNTVHAGILLVRLIGATNLPAADLNGLADPYVVLKLGLLSSQSKVMPRTRAPVWNQRFTFNVPSLKDPLEFTVMDKDTVTVDDFMGRGSIDLTDLVDGKEHQFAVPLLDKKSLKSVDGQLMLECQFKAL